jgi:ABC-type cobalt transport system substrate-binding protein
MKKTDIAMIILIATVSVLVAFFVTRAVVGTPSADEEKVKTIEKIDAEITPPDTAIFNSDAINPAVEVQITPNAQ